MCICVLPIAGFCFEWRKIKSSYVYPIILCIYVWEVGTQSVKRRKENERSEVPHCLTKHGIAFVSSGTPDSKEGN